MINSLLPSDTIFALSTAPGRGGLAVLRVSGPLALDSLCALAPGRAFPERRAVFCDFAVGGRLLDQGIGLFFKGPRSFTGEDSAEFHVHGGRAVIEAFLAALGALPGLRPALPGEFTRRAFENGRIDLTAAEGIADLIDAETQGQREQALLQAQGNLGRLYGGWALRLEKILAHQEAEIEFPEDDMPSGLSASLAPEIRHLMAEMGAHLDDRNRGERLRSGISIAIVGAPNAGKSSLLNALARRDVAIVSDTAGTTRDVLEAHLDIAGFPVILADTAGLRGETQDVVEIEGQRRARARAEEADFCLAVFDAACEADVQTLGFLSRQGRIIVVMNKADLSPPRTLPFAADPIWISARTGAGLDTLLNRLALDIARHFAVDAPSGAPALSRPRHRALVSQCRACLERAHSARLPELAAEDMRLGLRALGQLTGHVGVEDLLDTIFRDFCIGK